MTIAEVLEADARILRAREDVDYLCKVIGARQLPPHARRIYQLIRTNQGPDGRVIVLTAPGCMKSTVLGLCMTQDLLGDDPHVLFASKSNALVQLTGDFVRHNIEKIFGQDQVHDAMKDYKGFKDSSKMFCVPGWDPISRNPSWVGATPGTDIEGIRANYGYLDDIIDQESSTSEIAREVPKQWFGLTFVERLNRGAPVAGVGSLWHPHDFHMELLARWPAHLFPFARQAKPEGFREYPRAVWHGEEYELLWPENYGGIDLAQFILDHDGDISYQLRFQLNPWVLKDTRFKPDWFQTYDTPLPVDIFNRLLIHLALDPATGKTEIGSESAITVLGLDKVVNHEYILESIAGIWDPVERRRQVQASFGRWHPRKIFVEDVGEQATIVTDLRLLDLPAFGLTPTHGKDKIARIDTLCVPVQMGQIKFHKSQQELIQQLLNFPKSKRLDRADSLEIAHRSFSSTRTLRRCM
jgi:hypothetical protein